MRFILLLIVALCSFAAQLNKENIKVQATSFYASDAKNIIKLDGNVKLDMGDDYLTAKKLLIKLKVINNRKTPVKFEATGGVKLNIKTKSKEFLCQGDKILFKPIDDVYVITGDGFVHDITEQKELHGEKIIIDVVKGEATIVGTKNKPVKFIMKFDTKK
ncbi:MAG: lipopolysaccharide transport periplasmic protein LptA [Epsilonproteobacteria bacterium]|nr:MAG: lipopolysaccharide transport periplasmic protein LptA [Campylobacterota bacterium]